MRQTANNRILRNFLNERIDKHFQDEDLRLAVRDLLSIPPHESPYQGFLKISSLPIKELVIFVKKVNCVIDGGRLGSMRKFLEKLESIL